MHAFILTNLSPVVEESLPTLKPMPARILLIDRPHEILVQKLSEWGCQVEEDYHSDPASLIPKLANVDGIVLRSRIAISESLIQASPMLRFVAREGVGTEHIDLEACRRHHITVLTSAEGSRDTVAEHTMGLLLCLMNRIATADRQVRAGQWLREPNRGTELLGKTVGILGYGNMGSAFARRLTGFGVRTIAYDKYKSNYGDEYAEEVSLEQLHEQADVLSIHIPYMPQNHYFIDGDFLDRFRKPIFLVNTARGLVLKTDDLVERLESGRVTGAALDVLEYEEQSFDKFSLDTLPPAFEYLRNSDRVVLTPHIAGWSFESKRKHAQVLARKIAELLGKTVDDEGMRAG